MLMGAFDAARAASAMAPERGGDMLTAMATAQAVAMMRWWPPPLPAAPRRRPSRLPEGFVYLRDVDPSIAQDMRYAGADNFTGRPLPGYDAAECVLRRDVAEALARVQADLARENLGLKVYDCYRPTRAVPPLRAGRKTSDDDGATKRFYPDAGEAPLFAARLHRRAFGAFDRQRGRSHARRSCPPRRRRRSIRTRLTAPAPRRPRSARPTIASTWAPASTASTSKATRQARAITPEQKRWRALLVAAMRARGFHNYFREWWHFSLARAGRLMIFRLRRVLSAPASAASARWRSRPPAPAPARRDRRRVSGRLGARGAHDGSSAKAWFTVSFARRREAARRSMLLARIFRSSAR